MAKATRPAVKTFTLIKSRDIVADKLLKPCEEGNHSRCTGWAVLKREISPIDVNYFLKCTCTCHRKKERPQLKKKQVARKQLKKKVKKKARKKLKPRRVKKSRKSRKARRR